MSAVINQTSQGMDFVIARYETLLCTEDLVRSTPHSLSRFHFRVTTWGIKSIVATRW